ncbi:hypothetical protein [Companilactobacillus paralimentarius]|uniref:hypothetical protein n=1 Tax=Companilactobacillus paralimentarius TaxID=83526 RepID=UPI00384C91B6
MTVSQRKFADKLLVSIKNYMDKKLQETIYTKIMNAKKGHASTNSNDRRRYG